MKAHKDIRTLPSAPTVSGTVVDPAGKPVRGALVLLEDRNLYRDSGARPKTDAAGSFSITAVSPGNHVLVVFSLDWALKPVAFSVPLKEPLKIVMQKGKRVEFRTVDTQGKPIAGIRFYPQAPRDAAFEGDGQIGYFRVLDFLGQRTLIGNISDKQGIFRWENAPDERLGYQIIARDVLSQPGGEYGPVGSPHTLVFRKRIPVHAKVVDAASGEPIESYQIIEGTHFKVNPPELWTWSLRRPSAAKPGGFDDSLKTLDRLIRYRIQAEGYRPAVSKPFDAQNLPGDPISIEFRLKKDAGYSAVVQTPGGQPAADAKVYTVVKRRGEYSSFQVVAGVANPSAAATVTITDVDGEMRIAPSSDSFLCFISHESGYAELIDVDLFKQSKISLVPWGKIDGVLMVRGKPAANIKVDLNQREPFAINSEMPGISYSDQATTDREGRYRFDRCVAGQWTENIQYDAAPAGAVLRRTRRIRFQIDGRHRTGCDASATDRRNGDQLAGADFAAQGCGRRLESEPSLSESRGIADSVRHRDASATDRSRNQRQARFCRTQPGWLVSVFQFGARGIRSESPDSRQRRQISPVRLFPKNYDCPQAVHRKGALEFDRPG